MDRGIFIVIEGTDGSGKGTQFKLLSDYLRQQGYNVATFDFPQYEQPSSHFVKKYLNGDYGTAEEVGPYTGSLFYALDRFEAAPAIREALAQGKIVLANRFTGSNMGHQGTKFAHAEERRGYFIWLDNLEFEMLKIPRPTLSLVLRVPAEVAQSLVDQKETRNYTDKKRDLHEADLTHLQRAVAVYDDLCQLFPKDFQRIDCVRGGELLSIETVHELVRQKIQPLLPPPVPKPPVPEADVASEEIVDEGQTIRETNKDSQGNYKYLVPEQLPVDLQTAYHAHMDEILRLHANMVDSVAKYITNTSDAKTEERDNAWQNQVRALASDALYPVLPVATAMTDEGALAISKRRTVKKLAHDYLPDNHADTTEAVQLTSVWPRNEFDLLPDMLYEHSNLPLQQIKDEIASWSYDKKLQVFEAYIGKRSAPGHAFEKVHYSWDITCDYATFCDMQSRHLDDLERQELTPRYGYDMPELVEEAGLVDEFERCFEISLKLHSLLQANGFMQEAQYATLLGHKMRCKMSFSASEAFDLNKPDSGAQSRPGYRKLVQHIQERLTEIHPILGETIKFAKF